MRASIKNIKLPDAPEPTRAVYKKPVVGTYAPGMRVIELPSVYNPRPAPIPKRESKPEPTNYRKDDKVERAVKAGKSRWWTEERIRTLIELHKQQTITYESIAKQMGTTRGAISAQVKRLTDRGILNPREDHDLWTPEDIDQLMELRAEGKTFGEIGDILGKPHKTCSEKYRRQNEKQNLMRGIFS